MGRPNADPRQRSRRTIGGAVTWSVAPSVSMPLLGGTNRGNLDYAKAQRDYYLATYEKAAQTAYKEVADGLADRARSPASARHRPIV